MKKKTRLTAGDVLAATSSTRRTALRQLIGEGCPYPTQVDMCRALGITESYLSQLIGPKPVRRITETTARKFEYKLRLPVGALDRAG